MLTLLGFSVFGGAFGIAMLAIVATILPRFDQIIAALHGARIRPAPIVTSVSGGAFRRRAVVSPAPVARRLRAVA